MIFNRRLFLHIVVELNTYTHVYVHVCTPRCTWWASDTREEVHATLIVSGPAHLLALLRLLASYYESTSFSTSLPLFRSLVSSLPLSSDPASSLSPRVTRDLVMMTPAWNVHGGPIYRNREPIPVYLRSQWPSPYERIIFPCFCSPWSPLFFQLSKLVALAGTFSSMRTILNEYRFLDSIILVSYPRTLSIYLSIR